MTVNPDLATLMRVIEENQDKMTEGEYLEAMNALCSLHRVVTFIPPASPAPALPLRDRDGYSPYAPSSPPYSSIWDDE
jgi:hypothetical protein